MKNTIINCFIYEYMYMEPMEPMEPCVLSRMENLDRGAMSVFNTAPHHLVYVYRYFLLAPLAPWLREELIEI